MRIKYKNIVIIIIFIIIISILINKIILSITYRDEKSLINKKDLVLSVGHYYNSKEFFKIKGGYLKTSVIKFNDIGSQEVIIYYQKGKFKKKARRIFKIIDNEEPLVLVNTNLNVYKGTKKEDLINMVTSGDNYDEKPKRYFEGDIDLDKIGTYNLVYVIRDSSGNETRKKMLVKVIEKKKRIVGNNNVPVKLDLIDLEHIKNNKKNEKTEIGIDVSKWQKEIDFQKVKSSGISFVIIRLGHQKGFNGDLILDPYFEQNYHNAIKNNLKVGVYFYSYALNDEDAKKQAKFVLDNLKHKKINMHVAFDWEDFKYLPKVNLSFIKLNQLAEVFLKEIKNKGYKVVNYSSKYYLENIWNINQYDTWLAHYTFKTNYKGPYIMHQLTDKAAVPGVKGPVDVNIYYKKGK